MNSQAGRDPSVRWRGGARLLAPVLFALVLVKASCGENWDRFRGPNGSGESESRGIPTEWHAENFLWRTPLAGTGHSSPVVWGGKVFVQSGDAGSGAQIIEAIDATTGTVLWQTRIEGPEYRTHQQNSYASSTPAVDRERLYVLWLAEDGIRLAAFSHEGKELWQREVGPFKEIHGFGKSPIAVDGLVIVATDSEAESAIVAYEGATGEEGWRIARPSGTTSFATPCLLDPSADRQRIVTASTAGGLAIVDCATGKIVGEGIPSAFPVRCVASPIAAGAMVFGTCGEGGNGKELIAARVTQTGLEEAYRQRAGVPQVPTPVARGDLVFLWHDRGIVSCIDRTSGDVHWRERIGGNYSSSPVRVGSRLFGVASDGEVIVLAAEREFKLLARNSLGELTRATPAIANGRMFLRTESSLVCIGGGGDGS